jgi:serine/threonine protein kinase
MSGGSQDSRETERVVPTQGGVAVLPVGHRLEGRYTIRSFIAAGGFGITYAAMHDGLGRMVAIKEHFPRQVSYREGPSFQIRPTDTVTYAWALDRFLQEGRSLARCKHPNVVDVSDIFEANGSWRQSTTACPCARPTAPRRSRNGGRTCSPRARRSPQRKR